MYGVTHYERLGVSRKADASTIRRAYVQAARQAHPDRPTGDERLMRELNAAWAVLSNPETRAAYDRTLARPTPIPPQANVRQPERHFQPHPAYSGVVDDDPMDLDDDGDPATNPGGAALVLPVLMWIAAFVCTVYGLLGGVFPLVAMGFILAVLGGIGFLAAPLLALGKASSAERSNHAGRRGPRRRSGVFRP